MTTQSTSANAYLRPLLTFAALSSLAFLAPEPASAQFGLCNYIPTDAHPVRFPKVEHTTGGALYDTYLITPEVRVPVRLYREIRLRALDRFTVQACGCVQTGGAGKSWKSYVTPRGRKSDRLYSGTIALLYDNKVPPPSFWQNPTNMMRIGDFIRQAGPQGFTIPPGYSARLLIGYQDDDYGDNGYWGHDDGTDGQCRGVGPASIKVTVYHRSR